MSDLENYIEIELNKRFPNIKILIKYEPIHKYRITLICTHLPLETGIIRKTIVFAYDFMNNYMVSSNINQMEIEIKNILKKEGVKYE